jgi:hypothetical protein
MKYLFDFFPQTVPETLPEPNIIQRDIIINLSLLSRVLFLPDVN